MPGTLPRLRFPRYEIQSPRFRVFIRSRYNFITVPLGPAPRKVYTSPGFLLRPPLVHDDGTDPGLPQFPLSPLGITSSPLRPDPTSRSTSTHVFLAHIARGFDGVREASPSFLSPGTWAADGQHIGNTVCLGVWATFCYSNYQIYSCYLGMSRFVNMITTPLKTEKSQYHGIPSQD